MEIFMDQSQVKEFKLLFRELKKNYLMNDFSLEEICEGPLKGDEVDLTIEDRDKALFFKLRGRQDIFLKKVNQAEERISSGRFGECLECGHEISLDRLRARPMAGHCIDCKEEQEREEIHVVYHKKSHTHGKTFHADNVTSLPLEKIKEASIESHKILKFNKERIHFTGH